MMQRTPLVRVIKIICLIALAVVGAVIPVASSWKSNVNPEAVAAAEIAYARGTELSASDSLAAAVKFRESADGFAVALAEAHGEGAALRFNHANSLLRAGDLGEAIAEYRAAALRAPSDARIQTNLSEARGQVARSPGVATPTILQRICGVWDFATEQMRWIATIALLWIGCAVLTLNTHWRSYGLTAFACALLLGTTVMLDVARRNSSAAAVFIDLAVIRKGNGEGFELTIAQPLPEGTECEVIESRLGWIQVELADGTRGWVDDQAIIRVN